MPKLTKKQRMFAKNYALTENGTQSVIEAEYDVKSAEVAKVIASENLTKPNVVEAIKNEQKNLLEALEAQGITPQRIAEKIDMLLEGDANSIDKGLNHAIKAGVGGGYAPEKSISLTGDIDILREQLRKLHEKM